MEFLQLMILISACTLFGMLFLGWIGWLYALHYILIPKFLRGVMYMKSGSRKLIWLKKIEEKDGLGTAANAKYGSFSYNVNDIFRLGTFSAIDLSEGSFKAIRLKQKDMQMDSERSLHPKILHDILNNKFIRELLETKLSLTDILVIGIAAVLVIHAIYHFVSTGDINEKLDAIQSNASMTQSMIQNYLGQVRP